jgi:hypothetical protein
MTLKEFRQNIRRSLERRLLERRIIPFSFGSTEWVRLIQQEYLLWPKKERRFQDRRNQPRREGFRRNKNLASSRALDSIDKWSGLLTKEELQMINELVQSETLD